MSWGGYIPGSLIQDMTKEEVTDFLWTVQGEPPVELFGEDREVISSA